MFGVHMCYVVYFIWVLVTSIFGTLFKHSNSRNYSLKKLIVSISNELNTIILIKIYYLKVLKSTPEYSLTFPILFFFQTTYAYKIYCFFIEIM
jgi:hypothetical protein